MILHGIKAHNFMSLRDYAINECLASNTCFARWPSPLGSLLTTDTSSPVALGPAPDTDHHHEQLNRFRFRHHPQAFLASLEARWEQVACT